MLKILSRNDNQPKGTNKDVWNVEWIFNDNKSLEIRMHGVYREEKSKGIEMWEYD